MRQAKGEHNDKGRGENVSLTAEQEPGAILEKRAHMWYYIGVMPLTKGAIRKLRADKVRAVVNSRVRKAMKQGITKTRKKATQAALKQVYRVLDKAAQRGVVHRNKAARLKSRLARLGKKK